jgi:hypothetical protein
MTTGKRTRGRDQVREIMGTDTGETLMERVGRMKNILSQNDPSWWKYQWVVVVMMMTQEGCGRKWLCSSLRYYPGIKLVALRNTTTSLEDKRY